RSSAAPARVSLNVTFAVCPPATEMLVLPTTTALAGLPRLAFGAGAVACTAAWQLALPAGQPTTMPVSARTPAPCAVVPAVPPALTVGALGTGAVSGCCGCCCVVGCWVAGCVAPGCAVCGCPASAGFALPGPAYVGN